MLLRDGGKFRDIFKREGDAAAVNFDGRVPRRMGEIGN